MTRTTLRRWARVLPVLGATIALMAGSSPASADPGNGVVTGGVTLDTGLNLAKNNTPTCATWLNTALAQPDSGRTNGYVFTATNITGTVSVGTVTAAGTIAVTAADDAGSSTAVLSDCDDADAGSGPVILTSCAGPAVVTGTDDPGPGGSVSCAGGQPNGGSALTGDFTRLGSTVLVDLGAGVTGDAGTISICDNGTNSTTCVTDANPNVQVVAQFVPTNPTPSPGGTCDGIGPPNDDDVCVTEAVFGGDFTVT